MTLTTFQLGVALALVVLLMGFKVGVKGNDRISQFGKKNTNVDEAYERVNLRRIRSHLPGADDEPVPVDALKSAQVDVAVLNSMGSAELAGGIVDRKRRNQDEVDLHAQRAESDAIAAAAESAAAEADAVAAAVEATEIESANDNRGVGRGLSTNFVDSDDSGITFEENDDGDNVVVLRQDVREKQHTGGSSSGEYLEHHGSGSHGTAQFDVLEKSGNGMNGDHIFQSHTPDRSYSSEVKPSHSDGSLDMADIKTPLNELLVESSGLAKEIRLIFQVLARREDYLVQEMEKLKVALQNAIIALQESNNEAKIIRKRRGNDANPYKACVYINPPSTNQNNDNFSPPESLIQNQAQPLIDEGDQMPSSAAQTGGPGGDEIDLNSVYWLKLPENQDEGILEKVHRVLGAVRDSGKDVLFIPVTKSYMSNEDVANGFLRTLRVNPAYATSVDSKQQRRRKKLRLRIRRI